MSRRALVLTAVVLTTLAAVAGAGCERRSQTGGPAEGEPAATIVATADHGARVLLDERVAPGGSVMDALRSVTPVETAYGGGFVQSMLGRSSATSPPADWFFYVNGFESPVGARSSDLVAGDVAWWDHRGWQGMQSVRAVVGSWPQPFLDGPGGGGARPRVAADPPLAGALRAAGATLVEGDAPFRARVGTDSALASRDGAWRAIGGDPASRALPGGIADGRVVLMPAGGGEPVPVPAARAVAVLVPAGTRPEDGALFAVAGLDAPSAKRAAASIARDPGMLSLRYAVAFDGSGAPIRAAGRSGP